MLGTQLIEKGGCKKVHQKEPVKVMINLKRERKTTAVRHTANGLERGCFNLATIREGQTKH
jgi:hypothetical protein